MMDAVDVNESDARCPVAQGSLASSTAMRSNRDWWPKQLNLKILHQQSPLSNPMGAGVRLRRGVQVARPRRAEGRPARADDRQPALVAGGLRPLRPAVHPHGLAQRRHLSPRRRPRRRGRGAAALRAAQQLAGQRQPRQGPPPALADQGEVRRQDLLGRPDDPHRQRRARIDGLQAVRLRRRPRGRLGARGGRLLGQRGHLARRQALLRRPRAGEPARRGADGPDLRQPRRP